MELLFCSIWFQFVFFLAFPDGTPGKVLLDSFLTAAAFFFLMSGIRKLIHLGMEKPPAEKEEGIPVIPEAGQHWKGTPSAANKEYGEDEIAAVIRTLMKEE